MEIATHALRAFRGLQRVYCEQRLPGVSDADQLVNGQGTWFRIPERYLLESASVSSLVVDELRIWEVTPELRLLATQLKGRFYVPQADQGQHGPGAVVTSLAQLVGLLRNQWPEVIGAVTAESQQQRVQWWPLDYERAETAVGRSTLLQRLQSSPYHWEPLMDVTAEVIQELADGRQLVKAGSGGEYFIREYETPTLAHLHEVSSTVLRQLGFTLTP